MGRVSRGAGGQHHVRAARTRPDGASKANNENRPHSQEAMRRNRKEPAMNAIHSAGGLE